MRKPTLTPLSLLLAAAMILLPGAALALCIAVVTNALTVNGIVVSPNLPAGPSGCAGDPGWAGVVGRQFQQIGGEPGDPADKPSIFLAGFGTPLTKFYVGIHVPYDPDLQRQDRLTLYVDANNSNALDVGDFALVYEIGPSTPIVTGESCDIAPSQVQVYHHNGTNWGAPTLSAPGVTSRFAHDYDSKLGDPEADLWELEIEMDAATLGLSPAGFRVGAKLLPHEFAGSDVWQTWVWPEGLSSDPAPLHYLPGYGDVLPARMALVDFTACADVTIDAISATDANGANNKFRRPLAGDWVAGVLPANKRNQFSATVRFFNPSDPSDNSTVGVPNTGTAQFTIRPWGGGDFLGQRTMANSSVSFDHLGQVKNLSFGWPVQYADYQPIESAMNHSDHSCLKVQLNGFPVNLDPAGDVRYRNLTYTQLSTRTDTFLVTTRSRQGREIRAETDVRDQGPLEVSSRQVLRKAGSTRS